MTSLKGPSSEHGDTSPDVDVLTGPPAEPVVAPKVALEVPEPMPEPTPEPAPIAEGAPTEAPPPTELPIDADEPEDIGPPVEPSVTADPEEQDSRPDVELAVEPAAAPDEIAEPLAIAEETPADAAPPEAVAEYNPAEPDVAEPPSLSPVEPASSPAPEPPQLPDITASPPASEIVAPILALAPLIRDLPTQPAPAPPLLPPVPPIATTPDKPTRAPWRVWLRRAILAFVGLATGYAVLILVLIGVYRTVDPPRSTVMLGLNLTGQSVDYEPVPITSISSYLQRAVITSEDARFCRHRGVDWGALAEAMQDSRGGSTITMQTAKNLFLWPSRSYIRKAIEIPVALMIDFAWPKRRILEVYLNIAEWGPGVFGAEAAAQYHFGKSASRLTAHEATLLAASLPNPIAREAGDPGRVTALLASRLRARMANSDVYVSCLGLRPMPRAEPKRAPKSGSVAPSKPAPKPSPWQTRTEPAKPPTPFNPWKN